MTLQTDVVIIGAGPVGLFQVFELGLQGLESVIIDALPDPGGQCIELYPDKPIYDIPAVPICTGRELVDNGDGRDAGEALLCHIRLQVATRLGNPLNSTHISRS